MKKIFLIFAIILAVLITVSMVAGIFYLGPIVKIGIEQVGPQVTQVSVKVDSVEVSLWTGSAKVKGLMVGNPQGYTTPQAIKVGTIAVSMDPFSVTSPKIVMHSIQVESPEITFEGGLGSNNLSKILGNLKSAPAQNSSKPAPKIEVDDFSITGAKVHVNLSGLVSKDISLPDIHLTDLGKGNDGLTPVELAGAVLNAISSGTVKAVAGSVGGLSQTMGQGVSKITSSLGSLFGK